MTIEHALAQPLQKPWGVIDLRPWNCAGRDGNTIGEICYQRPGSAAIAPLLLLKLLFTDQRDAVFAQSDRVGIRAGARGLAALVASTDEQVPDLLACVVRQAVQ